MGEQDQIDKILEMLARLAKAEVVNVEIMKDLLSRIKFLEQRLNAIENRYQGGSKPIEFPSGTNRFDL